MQRHLRLCHKHAGSAGEGTSLHVTPSHAVHTGAVSATEHRGLSVREVVHTQFNGSVHTGLVTPRGKIFLQGFHHGFKEPVARLSKHVRSFCDTPQLPDR